MDVSLLDLAEFVRRGAAAQSAVDRAITRADLVVLVARRRRLLRDLMLERDNAVTDAQLKLGAACAALEDFDRKVRR